jgi:hypothetical protein
VAASVYLALIEHDALCDEQQCCAQLSLLAASYKMVLHTDFSSVAVASKGSFCSADVFGAT